MAQPLLLLTPRLKALRCLFPSSSPAVPAGATEWWADVTHGEMLQLSYTDSKTLCPISWPATFQWILLRKPECKFCFSDLFWPNQNMKKALNSSSLAFVFCLYAFHTVCFLMPIFLPDIIFKLCTHHLPFFLYFVLFYIYSLEIKATNYSLKR